MSAPSSYSPSLAEALLKIFFSLLEISFWPAVILLIIWLVARKKSIKHDGERVPSPVPLPRSLLTGHPLAATVPAETVLARAYYLLSLGFLYFGLLLMDGVIGLPMGKEFPLLVTSIVGLYIAYRRKLIEFLGFSLAGIMLWWIVQGRVWGGTALPGSVLLAGTVVIAITFFFVGSLHQLHPRYKRFAAIYRALGILWTVGALFVFSTSSGLVFLEKLVVGDAAKAAWPVVLAGLVLVEVMLYAAFRAWKQKSLQPGEIGAAFAIAALFVAVPLLIHPAYVIVPTSPQVPEPRQQELVVDYQPEKTTRLTRLSDKEVNMAPDMAGGGSRGLSLGLSNAAPAYSYSSAALKPLGSGSGIDFDFDFEPRKFPELSDDSLAVGVVFNVAVFLTLLGLILQGYARRDRWTLAFGMGCLSLLAVVKYFDWFYETLDRSLLLVGAGVLLFTVGWLMERARRGFAVKS